MSTSFSSGLALPSTEQIHDHRDMDLDARTISTRHDRNTGFVHLA